MKYDEARPLIKSGDLLAWSHRGWKSWYDVKIQLVRMFTRSEFAHVGVAWVVGGRVLCLEAVVPKVRIYPLSSLGSFYCIQDEIDWSAQTEELALSLVGTEYSQLEALAAFFGRTIYPAKMQCAKFVATLMGLHVNNRTPSDIVEIAMCQGGTLEYIENGRE